MPSLPIGNTFEMTERIRALAQAAAKRGADPPLAQRPQNQTHAYYELYQDLPLAERQARSFAYALTHEPVRLFPDERINGVWYGGTEIDPQWSHPDWGIDCAVTAAERRIGAEIPEFAELGQQCPPAQEGKRCFLIGDGASPGHIAWNYDLILSLGVNGLIARHREALDRTDDPRAQAYYQAVLICLDAMLEWNRLHVEEMRGTLDQARTSEERAAIDDGARPGSAGAHLSRGGPELLLSMALCDVRSPVRRQQSRALG
jgi:hypothetical protein